MLRLAAIWRRGAGVQWSVSARVAFVGGKTQANYTHVTHAVTVSLQGPRDRMAIHLRPPAQPLPGNSGRSHCKEGDDLVTDPCVVILPLVRPNATTVVSYRCGSSRREPGIGIRATHVAVERDVRCASAPNHVALSPASPQSRATSVGNGARIDATGVALPGSVGTVRAESRER